MANLANSQSNSESKLEQEHFPSRSTLGAIMTLGALAPLLLGANSEALAKDLSTQVSLGHTDSISNIISREDYAAQVQRDSFVTKDGRQYKVSNIEKAESSIVAPDGTSTDVKTAPDASTPKSSADNLATFLLKGGALALGCAGAIGAMRGTAKVAATIKDRVEDHEALVGRECTDVPSCNFHLFKESGDKLNLEICSIDKPELDDIFKNSYTDRVFKKAVSQCSSEKPFPSLNLDSAADSLIESKVLNVFNPRRSENLILTEVNKLLRDAYSSLYREGVVASGLNLPVRKDTHVLVPICEVSESEGRDLVFVALSMRDFERFADEKQVAKMISDNPLSEARIKQLHRAHGQQTKFREENWEDLFPRVNIFVKA